jgi:hypothetical protein
MTIVKRLAGATALGAMMWCGAAACSSRADAAFIMTIEEVGSDVDVVGSGSIDFSGLTFFESGSTLTPPGVIDAVSGDINAGSGTLFVYQGLTGPSNFGSGGFAGASSVTGVPIGEAAGMYVLVPQGYVSGDALSDSMTFTGSTFADLGVTPGTYVWTWGTGRDADSFTLQIGPTSVPEPASLALLSAGLVGLGLIRRKRAQ